MELEARIARLESDVAHILSDVSEIKADLRAQSLESKLDGLKDTMSRMQAWALLLYITLAGSLFATMARGFEWI